jgi:hypothetical protein
MHIHRIAAGACTLCLVVPAAAAAQPIRNSPVQPAQHAATTASAPTSGSSGTGEEWRVAAIAEASLLAAGAAGAGLVLARRRRGSQLGV